MAEETATTGPGESAEKIENFASHAKQAASDLRTAAGAKVNELRSVAEGKVNELRGHAEHAYDDVRNRARTLRSDGEQYVRENPTRAILTALGIGFVLGLMFRK